MKKIYWHEKMFITYDWMSNISCKTVYTIGISYREPDKFTLYCQVYYFLFHQMNTGNKGFEKLGYNLSKHPPVKFAFC